LIPISTRRCSLGSSTFTADSEMSSSTRSKAVPHPPVTYSGKTPSQAGWGCEN